MKRASAIVTNRGGRTCHAAIIARELGIPAVVGTGDGHPRARPTAGRSRSPAPRATPATSTTGVLDFVDRGDRAGRPCRRSPVKIMMNVGTPDQAFAFSRLPNAGVGLARLEFIINRQIGIHPKALLDLDQLDGPLKRRRSRGDRGVRQPARLLRQAGRRGGLDDRRGVRAEAGDRADERLQVQRVRQPGRRRAVRAARGEPDDRLPRRVALPVAGLRRLLRDGVRGAALRPRRDGPDQRQDHDPVRPHPRPRPRA